MHYRASSLAVLSAAALVLSGCEWGGAHENTWNDGYSWLNFTGTYALSELAALTSSGSTSSEGEASESSVTPRVTKDFPVSRANKTGPRTYKGTITLSGKNPKISVFSVTIGTKTATGDPETGIISGDGVSGTFGPSGGEWTVSTTALIDYDYATATGTYTYDGVATPSGVEGGGVTISYLHVTQKGNVLTITDSAGTVYNGRTTGSSGPANGYENAGSASMSFEASSAGGSRMVGSLTGVWSGSTDKTHGTLSGRTIHATISTRGSNVDVIGTAPNMVIAVSE